MQNIWDNPDLLVVHGSRLFGCDVPGSDEDLRGFVIPSLMYLLGREKFEQYEPKEEDTVIWAVDKFFKLLEKGAPNAVEILFAPADCIKIVTDQGALLIDYRSLFVSRKLTNQIRGFAGGEWRKAQLLHKDKETGEIRSSTRVVGAQRKESYKQHGYCVKNAYHAVRLLEEGIELLTSGTLTFPRPNANELRVLRNGEFSLNEVTSKVRSLMDEFERAEEKSTLPEKPKKNHVNKLYLKIIEEQLAGVSSTVTI